MYAKQKKKRYPTINCYFLRKLNVARRMWYKCEVKCEVTIKPSSSIDIASEDNSNETLICVKTCQNNKM